MEEEEEEVACQLPRLQHMHLDQEVVWSEMTRFLHMAVTVATILRSTKVRNRNEDKIRPQSTATAQSCILSKA